MTATAKINILAVDDDPRNLDVLEAVLGESNYNIVRAVTSSEALLALMKTEFAVALIDVQMPEISGIELAHLIKGRKKSMDLPLIFLTAYHSDEQQVLEGYGSGAVDYLSKPINAAVLRSKVGVFAELFRRGKVLSEEVAERVRVQDRLQQLNAELDERVAQRTAELQASETKLRHANARKDEFLATLAHELRNPLAPIRNALGLLVRDREQHADWAIKVMGRQVTQMARLIEDLMDVSRIDQGRIALREELFDVHDAVSDALESVRSSIADSGHQLEFMQWSKPLTVHADRVRLSQALINILANAVKYTDPGGVVTVSVREESDCVLLCVHDSGIGIAPHRLESVFEMFSQEEAALTRARGGLGIGLALTRRLIELHGGTIRAVSPGLGQGSEFQVRVPCVSREIPKAELPPRPEDVSGLRVLIADDNVDAAEALALYLETGGNTVKIVHDGLAAVGAASDFAPQVIVLDIGMPQMDGYETCRRIRALELATRPVLVAVTGWGQPENLRASREAGFDHHLVKPVDIEAVLAVLGHVAGTLQASK